MKPTDYIEWDNLKDIPFFLCQVVEDREKQDLDIYYLGKRVLHDYDHVGHYLRTAVILFRRVKSRTADWVNLRNLWTLRNCVRENYNHGIGMNDLIFGENFDGDNLDTLTPLTKKRFDFLCKRIKELDHSGVLSVFAKQDKNRQTTHHYTRVWEKKQIKSAS